MNMDINIKMDDCKFFVDEEWRTVVCVIEDTYHIIHDFFSIGYSDVSNKNTPVFFEVNDALWTRLRMPARFVGKAVCAPEDEWNEEAGRLIAFDRAKHKLNVSFFKRAQLFVDMVDEAFTKMVASVNKYGERLSIGENRRQEHIQRITP